MVAITECEIRATRDSWVVIGIDLALELPSGMDMRCHACHGRLRRFPDFVNGTKRHFEHAKAHEGCPLTNNIPKKEATPHPEALT